MSKTADAAATPVKLDNFGTAGSLSTPHARKRNWNTVYYFTSADIFYHFFIPVSNTGLNLLRSVCPIFSRKSIRRRRICRSAYNG